MGNYFTGPQYAFIVIILLYSSKDTAVSRKSRTDRRKIINHRPEKVRKNPEMQNPVSLSGDGSPWVYIIIITLVQGLQ